MKHLKTVESIKKGRHQAGLVSGWRKIRMALLYICVGLVANCATEQGTTPAPAYNEGGVSHSGVSYSGGLQHSRGSHRSSLSHSHTKVSVPPIRPRTDAKNSFMLYENCEAFDIQTRIQNLFHLAPRTSLVLKSRQNKLPYIGSHNIQIQLDERGGSHITHCAPGVTSFELAALIPSTSSPLALQTLKLIVLPRPETAAETPAAETSNAETSAVTPSPLAPNTPTTEASSADLPTHLVPVAEQKHWRDHFEPPSNIKKLKAKKIISNELKVQLKWNKAAPDNVVYYKLTRCQYVNKKQCTNPSVSLLFAALNQHHNLRALLQHHSSPWSTGEATDTNTALWDSTTRLITLQAHSAAEKNSSIRFTATKKQYQYTERVTENKTYLYSLTAVNAVGTSREVAKKKIKIPRLRGTQPRDLDVTSIWRDNTYITQISFAQPEALPAITDYVLSTCVGAMADCDDPAQWHPLDVPLDLSQTSSQKPQGKPNRIINWLLPNLIDLLPGAADGWAGTAGKNRNRHVRVQARDSKGRFIGNPSQSIQLKAQQAVEPVAEFSAHLIKPEPLQLQDLGVQLRWATALNRDDHNLHYTLQRALCTQCAEDQWRTLELSALTALQHKDQQALEAGQTYSYRVRAAREGQHGAWRYIQADVPALPPQAPEHLRAVKLNTNSVKISWPAVVYTGGSKIEGYTLERSHTPDNWMTIKSNISADVRAYTDLGLLNPFVPGQKYSYRLSVRNARGHSEFVMSKPLLWLTQPDEPTALTALAMKAEPLWASDLGFNLKWEAPVNNGGTEITTYKLERCQGAISVCSYGPWKEFKLKPRTQHLDQYDLKPATTYTYKVSALNSEGESEASQATSMSTPAILPEAPEQLQVSQHTRASFTSPGSTPAGDSTPSSASAATPASLDGASGYHLFWQAPVRDGGGKILDYRVHVCWAQAEEKNLNCLPSRSLGWQLLQPQTTKLAGPKLAESATLTSQPALYTTHIEARELLKLFAVLPADLKTADRSFYYRIAARNKRGLGPFGNRQSSQAPRVASAPLNFKYTLEAPSSETAVRRLTFSWQKPQDLGWPFAHTYELQNCLNLNCTQSQPWQVVEAVLQGQSLQHSLQLKTSPRCYRVRAVGLVPGRSSNVLCPD